MGSARETHQSRCSATALIGGLLLIGAALAPATAYATGNRLSKPSLYCHDATQAALTIKVCVGSTGAPAGFVLKWLEGDASTPWPASDLGLCISRFYTRSKGHLLGPGECKTITIGEALADQATRTNCAYALKCGTTYGFKGFARATSTKRQSYLAGPVYCNTDPCTPSKTCTLTQGFWKTHGPVPKGNNENEWPVTSLKLGNVTYTDLQLLSILSKAPAGNGLITLAHQLIAAKLNVADGADPSAGSAAIAAADALIGARVVPPVGSGSLTPAAVSSLVDTLTRYNEGDIGPGHCSG